MRAERRAVTAWCAAIVLALWPGVTGAQDVADPNLKAEFIHRFATFTQWPATALPPAGPITLCVVGAADVSDALERNLRGLTIDKRPVSVAFVPADRPPASCHLMFISGVSAAQAARVVTGVKGTPVLTMSDLDGFNRMGGIAELFYEAGRVRYAIRIDIAEQSQLQVSSQLLRFSRPPR